MLKRALLKSTLLVSTILLATACTSKAPEAETATPAPAASVAAASTTSAPATASSVAASSTAAATTAPAPAEASIPPPKGMPAGVTPVEGTDFFPIDTPDLPSGDKVQVVEVFGYSCIHCADFQPHLAAWKKHLPVDVQFSYLPAAFGGIWDAFARAYYAAQAMGVQEKSHDNIFKAVFVDKRITTAEQIPSLYADYGVDPKVFASTMQSFAVSAKVAAAHDQATRWGIDGTPTIVVDGKYRVQQTAAGPEAFLHTIDWLVAKQRPEHARH